MYYGSGFGMEWWYLMINGVVMRFGMKILGGKLSMKRRFGMLGVSLLVWFLELVVKGGEGVGGEIVGGGEDLMGWVIGGGMWGGGVGVVLKWKGSRGGREIMGGMMDK